MRKEILFMGIFLFLFSFVNADIISVNSGGSNEIIINPGGNIEGFFVCTPNTCGSLGYNCDSWSDGCGGTINCGSCASGYTCSSGTCVATPTGGAPGGGGPSGAEVTISVVPMLIDLTMVNSTAVDQKITITNLKSSQQTVSISQSGLDNMVFLDDESITLAGKESKQISVRFVAPVEPGVYTGKIKIGNKQVLVTLNVKTKLLLFDSNIVVLNRDYKVQQGNELKTKVELIPMGDDERLDVTLNYEIKDYEGKVYLTQSETVLVEKKMDFKRNFKTGMLPLGEYVVGLELVYPNGVAPSSAHFEVVKPTPLNFGSLVFYLIILILIVAIVIVLLLIRKKKREHNGNNFK